MRPLPASPSTVTISAPSTCTARSRHERTATPSSLHGARTADAVLAADVRPGEAESVPDEVGEEEARLDLLAVAPAVDGDVDARSRGSLSRARDHTIDEDADEMPQVVGRRVDRAPRLDLTGGRLARALRIDLEHASARA